MNELEIDKCPITNVFFLLDTLKVSIPNEMVSKQEDMTLSSNLHLTLESSRILNPMTVMLPSWIVSTPLRY